MKAITGREVPGPPKFLGNTFKNRCFRLAALFVILVSFGAAGCGPRITLVHVSEADRLKANQYVREGNEAYKNKDYYAALIKYLAAEGLNPNSGYICNYTGIAYLRLNYYENAIKEFTRSMALNSKYASAVNNLGSAYFAAGNHKKAEKYFKKAIKMKKDEASFYLNLGTLYFETKKPEKAIREWRKSLELDPDILSDNSSLSISISGENISEKDRAYFMARVYAAAGNIPKTIECLQDALMKGFSDIDAIKSNPDFDAMRGDERFKKFMADAESWKKPE